MSQSGEKSEVIPGRAANYKSGKESNYSYEYIGINTDNELLGIVTYNFQKRKWEHVDGGIIEESFTYYERPDYMISLY